MLYTETTMAMENSMPMQNNRPANNNSTAGTSAVQAGRCSTMEGALPGKCGNMVFPYIAMQGENPKRYDQKEALENGTLFPGLNLPFHRFSCRKPGLVRIDGVGFCYRRAWSVFNDTCR